MGGACFAGRGAVLVWDLAPARVCAATDPYTGGGVVLVWDPTSMKGPCQWRSYTRRSYVGVGSYIDGSPSPVEIAPLTEGTSIHSVRPHHIWWATGTILRRLLVNNFTVPNGSFGVQMARTDKFYCVIVTAYAEVS